MSERYSRLFTLPVNLYASGSPVVIAAGALLKDTQTGKVLVQLKIRNMGSKPLKAAKICIQPQDTIGKPLGTKVAYQYLDLNTGRNEDFGTKTPIVLPDASTRAYTVSVAQIIFADNTVWKATDEPWEPLASPATLDGFLQDRELITQYRIKFGADCRYKPSVHKDLWCCACGQWNRSGESSCYRCEKAASALLSLDMDALKADRDMRIAAQQQQAAQNKAAAQARVKKIKKLAMVFAPILVVAVIAALLVSHFVKKAQEEAARLETYHSAVALMEAGQYDDAIHAFLSLGEYKDSVQQIETANTAKAEAKLRQEKADAYESAESLMRQRQYAAAAEAFTALGEYEDSASMALECAYQQTLLYLHDQATPSYLQSQKAAYDWLSTHRDYKDAEYYLAGFVQKCVSRNQVDTTTNEISSQTVYAYDQAGTVSAYELRYYSEGKQSSGYIHHVRQENYGNWYVYEYRSESSSTQQAGIQYLGPFSPQTQNPVGISMGGYMSWDSIKSTNGSLFVSLEDIDFNEHIFQLLESGDYSYTEKGASDFLVNYNVDITADANGNIIGIVKTGKGTAHDKKPYTVKETWTYRYNEHGHWVECNWTYSENWGGKTETKNSTTNITRQYDEEGNLLSDKTNESTSVTTYEYAYVYCPETN